MRVSLFLKTMNDAVCDTLFLPLRQGMIPDLLPSHTVGFFNACLFLKLHDLSGRISNENLHCYTPFKSEYDSLKASGLHVHDELEDQASDFYDIIFIVLPKNVVESHYLIAHGLRCLKTGGRLICAAANNAGGARIQKWFGQFGLSHAQTFSKNKCRVVSANIDSDIYQEFYAQALIDGSRQTSHKTEFMTQPGIFGWNNIDKGSQLLTRYLPSDLLGRGADFGCGYGYLSAHILRHGDDVTDLHCIDVDKRAMDACEMNVTEPNTKTNIHFHWHDLHVLPDYLSDLDFVVMNPPFHTGRSTVSDLGISFIRTASGCLKSGGALWMVANMHLPYESVLSECFGHFDIIVRENGFKIIYAVR